MFVNHTPNVSGVNVGSTEKNATENVFADILGW